MKKYPGSFLPHSPWLAFAMLGHPLELQAGPPDQHLIAHWLFEAGSGSTVQDSSGNGHNGTITGAGWGTDVPAPAGSTRSLNFVRAEEDYVDTAAFDINDDFTISMWVNPVDLSPNQNLIGKHTEEGGNLLLVGFFNDGYHVRIRSESTEGGTLRAGWQHLLVTGEAEGDNTRVTFYRNGLRLWQGVLTTKVGDVSGGAAWTIGQDWDSGLVRSDFFDGGMDDVRIYDRALTGGEIEDLTAGFRENCIVSTSSELETQAANQYCDRIQLSAGTFEIANLNPARSVEMVGAGETASIIDIDTSAGPARAFFIDNGNSLKLDELTIQGGSATGNGGAVRLTGQATLEMTQVTMQNNFSGGRGGALSIDASQHAIIDNSTLTGNTGAFGGGGIFLDNSNNMSIRNSTISNNRVTASSEQSGRGGGIYIQDSNSIDIENAVLTGNYARLGGGVGASRANNLLIRNTTLSSNSAGSGGAVYAARADHFRIQNCTLFNNTAQLYGGGVYAITLQDWVIENSLLAGNRAMDGVNEIYDNGGAGAMALMLSGNLLGDSEQTFSAAFRNVTPVAGNILATSDSIVGPTHQPTALQAILDHNLADNGGPTQTHALRSFSIARNAGNNQSCPTTDQRGKARDDGRCDIGAFEFTPSDETTSFKVIPLLDGKVVVIPN